MDHSDSQIGGCGDRQSVYELGKNNEWTLVEGLALDWSMNDVPGDTVPEEVYQDIMDC